MNRFVRTASLRMQFLLLFTFFLAGSFPMVLKAQQGQPYLLWPVPAPIQYLSPLTALQLNAVALAGPPVTVPLQSSYNVTGIATPGTPYVGGFDGNGESFSASELGSSLQWKGVTFSLGPPDASDAVSSTSVPLPSGSYSSLLLLADLVNDVQPGTGAITIHYTDGTMSTKVQAFSDWVRARNNASESNVTCVPSRVFFNGSVEPNSTCVYGYALALDPSKSVTSVDLPANRNIVVLSMALLPPVIPGEITYSPAAGTYPQVGTTTLQAVFFPQNSAVSVGNATVLLEVNAPVPALATNVTWATPAPVSVGTTLGPQQLDADASAQASPVAVSLRDASRVNAFYHNGAAYRETGFDGQNQAYSYDQLGHALHYHGATFELGSPDVQNAASDDIIYISAGSYKLIYLLGAATQASPAQIFTLQYTDGTTTQQTLDISSWTAKNIYADETVVATTSMLNLSTGAQRAAAARVYGYTLAVDSSRILQSVTLPKNPAVVILAAGLSTGKSVPVGGSLTYTPPAGTALQAGNTVLHVDFAPNDSTGFGPSQGSVTIVALRPVLTVRADNITRMYGAPNPAFTGSVVGSIGGDQFTESYTTSASTFSAPGSYPVIPSVSGGNVSGYDVQLSPAVLTVTRATTMSSVISAQPSALQGGSVTLNIVVASTTAGVPTGTVVIMVSGKPFASANLVQGAATLVTDQLPIGSTNILASYLGDTNFLPSGTTPALVSVVPRDFLLTASHGTVLTGTTGSSPSLTFHVAPLNGTYSAAALFSVSADLPNGTYATFSPDHLAIDGGSQNVVLTLHTRKWAMLESPLNNHASLVSVAALFGLASLTTTRRRRSKSFATPLLRMFSLVVAGGAVVASTGCGTGYAAHAYPFTLTVTTGPVTHSVPLTLQIEASSQ